MRKLTNLKRITLLSVVSSTLFMAQSFAGVLNISAFKQSTSNGKSSITEVAAGDYIVSGTKFKLRLNSDKQRKVAVILNDTSGKMSVMKHEFVLPAGEETIFPAEGKWMWFDNTAGKIRIILKDKASGKKVDEWSVNIIEASVTPEQQKLFTTTIHKGQTVRDVSSFAYDDKQVQESLAIGDKIKFSEEVKLRGSAAKLYKAVSPGVVLITTKTGLGSGAVISNDGYIITNWHVIKGFDRVGVVFKPKSLTQDYKANVNMANVVKYDVSSDLALIKLEMVPDNLTVLKLSDFANVDVAMDVHAIGHPIGEYWTYTRGTVSQVRMNYAWQSDKVTKHKADVIQTQTPINPGNSGGPLFLDNGEVIGINSFGMRNAQGINFAVSSKNIEKLLELSKQQLEQRNKQAIVKKDTAKKQNGTRVDLDKDGREESVLLDTNGDGKPDVIKSDIDGDGNIDQIVKDRDFDGRADMIIKEEYSKEYGKKVVLVQVDTDRDGKFDKIGIDINKDGKIDRVIPI